MVKFIVFERFNCFIFVLDTKLAISKGLAWKTNNSATVYIQKNAPIEICLNDSAVRLLQIDLLGFHNAYIREEEPFHLEAQGHHLVEKTRYPYGVRSKLETDTVRLAFRETTPADQPYWKLVFVTPTWTCILKIKVIDNLTQAPEMYHHDLNTFFTYCGVLLPGEGILSTEKNMVQMEKQRLIEVFNIIRDNWNNRPVCNFNTGMRPNFHIDNLMGMSDGFFNRYPNFAMDELRDTVKLISNANEIHQKINGLIYTRKSAPAWTAPEFPSVDDWNDEIPQPTPSWLPTPAIVMGLKASQAPNTVKPQQTPKGPKAPKHPNNNKKVKGAKQAKDTQK